MTELLEQYGLTLAVVAGAVVVLWLAFLGIRRWRRGRQPAADQKNLVAIDVADLATHGPPSRGAQLTCYGEPIRLAVLVIAPVGRDTALPPNDDLPGLVEEIVPGMMQIVIRDQPQFHRWPPQLSVHGFVQAFFSRVPLPGSRGKGTPWCSVVGRCEHDGEGFLLGLVLCASRPIHLGQIEIESAGKWLDVLRIRDR